MATPLTDERWRRLETLFHAACDLPADDRAAFVARETDGDPDLARDLTGMLAHAEGGGKRIASAIDEVARIAAPASDWVGRRCGAYRITREIGRGGMGLVFEAVRDDDEYRKRVALKIAPFSRDRSAILERFRVERQILAELEHPCIARFLDGGSEGGVPFFVMEYVDGLPVTGYCDVRQLDLRARLALFRRICGAVHFAHQHLIVHRDLKPANILVAADGTPQLLDFGIAKLLDPLAHTDATAGFAAPWTPDYASPEQVRSRPVTTRTDVYSLGLILYQLVTGERAQIADASSALTLDQSICETTPPPPSERAAARGDRAAARALRGDVDTIVLTAIRKEPERRYETAAAFSDDIGRYLDGLPIHARPSTVAYRAGKFIRRHRAGATAAVVVVASLVGGFGAALFEARRADRRFEQVRALANTFIFDVHDQIEKLPGSTAARKSIVQTALVYLESLRQDVGRDPALARELAAGYKKIGIVRGSPLRANLGDTAGAIESYARAEALLAPLVARGDREARALMTSVFLERAMVRQGQGNAAAARDDLSKARALGDGLLKETPNDADLLFNMVDVYSASARLEIQRGNLPPGEQAARRALALGEQLEGLTPATAPKSDIVSSAHGALGQALENEGRLEEAMDHFREAIRIREAILADAPNNPALRRNLMIGYGNLGDILGAHNGMNMGDYAGAAAAYEKAVALAEWERQKDQADRAALFDYATARERLGAIEGKDPRRLAGALSDLEESEHTLQHLIAESPASDRYRSLDVLTQFKTAEVLEMLGRSDEALRRFLAVHDASAKLAEGPYKRNWQVRSSARLALLEARAQDRQAMALAGYVQRELAAKPLFDWYSDALTRDELAHAYVEIARHAPPADRAAAVRTAIAGCEDSLRVWKGVLVEPEIDRTTRLAAMDALLAQLRASASPNKPS